MDLPELRAEGKLGKVSLSDVNTRPLGNYAKFATFEDLTEEVLRGVRVGWLKDKEIVEVFLISLRSIYEMAKADKYINYCPRPSRLLTAFKIISPEEVKVVITAQDPYPNLLDAIGVAFASPAPPKHVPRSAQIINSCLRRYKHIGWKDPQSGQFGAWVIREKVLLLNAALTVEEKVRGGDPRNNKSHAPHWKDVVPAFLSLIPKKCVAVLFGDDARQLFSAIKVEETVKHVHPVARLDIKKDSDLNPFEEATFSRYRDFPGGGRWEKIDVFTEINERLKKIELEPVNWRPGAPGDKKLNDTWARMKGWT